MIHFLNFTNLSPDLVSGIKHRSAIVVYNGFAEANAQTRQANSTHPQVQEPEQTIRRRLDHVRQG